MGYVFPSAFKTLITCAELLCLFTQVVIVGAFSFILALLYALKCSGKYPYFFYYFWNFVFHIRRKFFCNFVYYIFSRLSPSRQMLLQSVLYILVLSQVLGCQYHFFLFATSDFSPTPFVAIKLT